MSDGAAFNNLKDWVKDNEGKYSTYQVRIRHDTATTTTGESSREHSLLTLFSVFLPLSALTIYNHDNDDGLILILILTMVVVMVGTNDVSVSVC